MVLLGRLLGSNGASCHVIRNLNALKDMPRIASYNIKDYPGAKPKKKRRGRGPGSHRGKTSGRGHKGQGQRGTFPYFQFEGGQTPFYRLVPKHGSAGPSNNKTEFQPLNLDKLQYFIDSGRIDPNETITMKVMKQSGVVQGTIVDGVKLLGMGADWFESKVNIEVSMATPSAIEAVERQGGKLTAVYFDKVGMRYHLKIKEPKLPVPRLARPPAKLMKFYADPVNRGYLADENEIEKLRNENRLKADKVAKQLEKLNVSQE